MNKIKANATILLNALSKEKETQGDYQGFPNELNELRKLREAQLYANEQRRDAADLDSEGGKKAEKGRARGQTIEEKLIIAGTDV